MLHSAVSAIARHAHLRWINQRATVEILRMSAPGPSKMFQYVELSKTYIKRDVSLQGTEIQPN